MSILLTTFTYIFNIFHILKYNLSSNMWTKLISFIYHFPFLLFWDKKINEAHKKSRNKKIKLSESLKINKEIVIILMQKVSESKCV